MVNKMNQNEKQNELKEYKNYLLYLSDWLEDLASEITEKDISTLDYFIPTINFSVSKMISQIRINHDLTRIKNRLNNDS